ncbi:unnamed protein product [Soboliphyme baturini]|uniref:RUN domain-containing protein n=1 Tax=Soboliphyme baturini TaxID=241478 RepID=A0A183J367_9BILA|nr:unnamed protein product [Soboliphyme baturini]
MIIQSLSYDNEQLGNMLIAFGSQHSFYTRRGFDPKYWLVFTDALIKLVDDHSFNVYHRRRTSGGFEGEPYDHCFVAAVETVSSLLLNTVGKFDRFKA